MMKHQKGRTPPTEERVHMALSAKEAARELGCDARTFRKFMRAITAKEDQPGQGNRYQIEEKSIKKLKQRFEEWNKPKAAAPVKDIEPAPEKAPAPKKTTKKSKKVEAIDITGDEDNLIEPTEDELMELDDAIGMLDLDLDLD